MMAETNDAERILIIEDDREFREMLTDALTLKGYGVTTAKSSEEGLSLLEAGEFDLVLTDVRLPGISGIEAIPRLTQIAPATDIIVMTAFSPKESAVEAVKLGAYDFFAKPFSLAELEVVIRRALEKRRLQSEVKRLKQTLSAGGAHRIVGSGAAMRQVISLIQKVAPLESTVLVTGESGTGKELAADTIHELSHRSDGPFIKVNCAAIPENLLESELFGHEKGAFTGAVAAKAGWFELAQGGTILLDEIGDMPLSLQPKLLRAVEQKQVQRVGGRAPINVDVRIVAATNQDLLSLAEKKEFREDLYYRLNVASVRLPPLRDRKEDIPLLAEHFIDRVNVRLGTDYKGVSSDGMEELMAFDWPGNVRQFSNVMERAAIVGESAYITRREVAMAFQKDLRLTDTVETENFAALLDEDQPAQPDAARLLDQDASNSFSLKQTLINIERDLILAALEKCDNKQTDAARLLGISAKNLWNKLQKHSIDTGS